MPYASTVRRQLDRLLRSGLLSFRYEFAAETSGCSVSSTWTARAEPADHKRMIAVLAGLDAAGRATVIVIP